MPVAAENIVDLIERVSELQVLIVGRGGARRDAFILVEPEVGNEKKRVHLRPHQLHRLPGAIAGFAQHLISPPWGVFWIAVFAAITVPYIVLLIAIGLPFNHTLVWLYVLPPGLLVREAHILEFDAIAHRGHGPRPAVRLRFGRLVEHGKEPLCRGERLLGGGRHLRQLFERGE